jgi:mRNA interferase MazF
MPISSKIKGYPFEVIINKGEIQGAILCDQIRSLDWKACKAKFAMHVPLLIMEDAMAKLFLLLPSK